MKSLKVYYIKFVLKTTTLLWKKNWSI